MTTLFVDSACDLPKSLIEKLGIRLMPATINLEDQAIKDYRDPKQTIEIYNKGLLSKDHASETAPTSTQEIIKLLEETLKTGETDIVIQTINRVRSPTYENALEAAAIVTKRNAKSGTEISIRVQDSRTIFTGQAVLAAHTIALMNKGVNGSRLRRTIDLLSSNVHAYQLPQDVFYLRERARKKGDKSVSWLGALLGKTLNICPIVLALNDQTFPVAKIRGFKKASEVLFEHAIEKVNEGLLSPFVAVSYAGNPTDLTNLNGFDKLRAAAKAKGYQMIISPMTLSGGVNMGPGTLSIAFATEPYEWATDE